MRQLVIEKLAKSWGEEYYQCAIDNYAKMSDEDILWEFENDAYNRGVDDAYRHC